MEKLPPAIPTKSYFTIGEVSDLCGVKPYVLRYWEQEFTQLKPMKRRGNRRYYQHHEVLLIRRIRELLYDEGFTISGARNRLLEGVQVRAEAGTQFGFEHAHTQPHSNTRAMDSRAGLAAGISAERSARISTVAMLDVPTMGNPNEANASELSAAQVRRELIAIRGLLTP